MKNRYEFVLEEDFYSYLEFISETVYCGITGIGIESDEDFLIYPKNKLSKDLISSIRKSLEEQSMNIMKDLKNNGCDKGFVVFAAMLMSFKVSVEGQLERIIEEYLENYFSSESARHDLSYVIEDFRSYF